MYNNKLGCLRLPRICALEYNSKNKSRERQRDINKLSCTNCGELKIKCETKKTRTKRNTEKKEHCESKTNQSISGQSIIFEFDGIFRCSPIPRTDRWSRIWFSHALKFMRFNSLIKICYLICVALCELKWNLFIDRRNSARLTFRLTHKRTRSHNISAYLKLNAWKNRIHYIIWWPAWATRLTALSPQLSLLGSNDY